MAMHKQFIEYKVRDVSRFIVTRYESGPEGGQGSEVIGEYTSADTAYSVGYALAQAEHRRLGWPLDDERIQYPRHPQDPTVAEVSGQPSLEPPTVMVGI